MDPDTALVMAPRALESPPMTFRIIVLDEDAVPGRCVSWYPDQSTFTVHKVISWTSPLWAGGDGGRGCPTITGAIDAFTTYSADGPDGSAPTPHEAVQTAIRHLQALHCPDDPE